MKYVTAISALLVMLPGTSTADEFFRCGSWLVSADVSVAELLEKCGKPTSREVSTVDDNDLDGIKVGTWTTETWRYDRGSQAAPMVVTIDNGQIRSIERGK
jgi:hypothetical protein